MKILSRLFHAIGDYKWGLGMMAAPEVLGFADDEAANALCKTVGVGTVAASALTHYELGLVKLIPFNLHLKIDALSGLLGLATPWALGFANNKKARNVVLFFFIVELLVVTISQPDPE